jgi:hypothetical protein
MTVSGAWSRYRRARPPKPPRLGRWQQVLADAWTTTLRLAYKQPSLIILVEPPPELSSSARRAAHGLAAVGRARVLGVSGADANGNSGDRTYLVLAKPNVIMNDMRLRGLAVWEVRLPVGRAHTTMPTLLGNSNVRSGMRPLVFG